MSALVEHLKVVRTFAREQARASRNVLRSCESTLAGVKRAQAQLETKGRLSDRTKREMLALTEDLLEELKRTPSLTLPRKRKL